LSIFSLTPRDELSQAIYDAMKRMQLATTPASKLVWAKRMNDARRARGDFDGIAEAKRVQLDKETR
jgi:hypothetical protein